MRDSAQIIHGFTPNALNIAAACALHSRCLRGPVTIGFQADFDAGTVSIGDEVVDLTKVNTVLIDNVDRPDARRVAGMSWTAPELPLLAGDMNLAVVRRSGLLRGYLQCQIPMPPPSPKPFSQQPPVITVCEKLKSPSNR